MDIRAYGKVFIIFLVIVFLQVMLFNNIIIGTWGITPLFYTLFILMLPFEMPGWVTLVLAFLLGYSIDIFIDTPGLNAGATVAMAAFRPWILNYLSPRDGYDSGTRPYLMVMGRDWFFVYSIVLVAIHHTVYNIFDEFGFDHFFRMLGKIVLTTLCTEVFIIFSQFIFFRKN